MEQPLVTEIPEELRAKHSKLLEVELDGHLLAFRPLTPLEADALIEASKRSGLGVRIDTARSCCVYGLDIIDSLVEEYPLTFAEDVTNNLIEMARGQAKITIMSAKNKWQSGGKNLGLMAEHLLAFKAYQGGQWSDDQFAGAMHIADLIDNNKGIFNLVFAYMKAMSRRRS